MAQDTAADKDNASQITPVDDNASKNLTSPAESTSDVSAASDNVPPSEPAANASEKASAGSEENANLKFIWSVTGIESEQITVAMNQEGNNLYGPAKYEPAEGDPWNGVAVGTVSGNKVNLVITALKGSDLVSSMLTGTVDNEALSGKFFQVSGGKISTSGDFSAYSIDTDLTSFTPAKVTKTAANSGAGASQVTNSSATTQQVGTTAVASTSSTTVSSTAADTSTDTSTSQAPVQLGGKTQYTDVHKFAQQYEIGGDLSGVPPGMGGAGGL